MPGRSTEEVVARLVNGLAPVRPLPPVRRQLLALAAMVAVTAAFRAGWTGAHPLDLLLRSWSSVFVAVALVLFGFAGLTLGLASRIPGRERLARASLGEMTLGIGIVAAVALALPRSLAEAGTFTQAAHCIGSSLLLAGPPLLLATALALRGAPWASWRAGLCLAAGSASLGALLVHLSCPAPGAWHWLLAHALAPLYAALPIGLLVASALARREHA